MKKIVLFLCLCTFLISLTGCTTSENIESYEHENGNTYAVDVVEIEKETSEDNSKESSILESENSNNIENKSKSDTNNNYECNSNDNKVESKTEDEIIKSDNTDVLHDESDNKDVFYEESDNVEESNDEEEFDNSITETCTHNFEFSDTCIYEDQGDIWMDLYICTECGAGYAEPYEFVEETDTEEPDCMHDNVVDGICSDCGMEEINLN